MNNNLLASQIHKLIITLLGVLLSCLPLTSVWAKGEATNIYSSPISASEQATYDTAGNIYNWGQGSDGQGADGDLLIDGFSLDDGVTRYDYQSVADVVEVVRVGLEMPCGLFAETTGISYSYKPDFPGDAVGLNCDMAAVMAGRVINVGALDVFNNADPQGKNIERVDFIFSDGITVTQPADVGHVVTEKSGNNNVKIAAILTLDNGKPASYGSLVTVYARAGTLNIGCPNLATDICYGVPSGNSRNNGFLQTSNANTTPPVETARMDESLGLAFVSLADLGLNAGDVYYGFSYFPPDVDSVTHTLTDPATFPNNTSRGGTDKHGDADMFGGTAGYFVLNTLLKNVSGVVVDADSNGIANVAVHLYLDDGNQAGQYDPGDTLQELINTDANGAYAFPRAMVGDYIIRVDTTDTDLTGPGYTTATDNLPVTVSDNTIMEDFTFTLPQITGSVFNDANANSTVDAEEAVPSVIVGLYNDQNMTSQVGSDGATDANGSFVFGDVANGTYYLFVDPDSSQDLSGLVTSTNPLQVVVENGADITTSFPFTAVASTTYSLTGTVFQDEDGDGQLAGNGESGVDAVTVTLSDSNNNQVGTTDTGSDGAYAFNVVAGDYTVSADSSDGPAGYAISQSDASKAVPLDSNTTLNFPFRVDTDGDGIPDNDDIDDDNDGILDSVEQNGANDVDTDGDGIWDRLDLDSDNDGILDAVESGASAITGVTIENGRITGAVDANGLPDAAENGSETGDVNYALLDSDGDTKSDFRDLDSDNDGISDAVEGGSTDPDGNGFIGSGNPLTLASNGVNSDGIPLLAGSAVISTPPNTDGDSVPDYRDLDSDNDGITDVIEAGGTDEDPNGRIGAGSPPAINDLGIPVVGLLVVPTDTDNDGQADFLELDSDNDGIKDITEAGYVDSNGDGLVDGFTDPDGDGAGNPRGFSAAADFPDIDFDGIPDYQDKVSQPPQLDTGLDGMGCTLSDNRSVDPIFPLLILFSFLYLMRGRFLKGRDKKVKSPVAKKLSVMFFAMVLIFPIVLSAEEETEFQSRWYGGLGIGVSELEPDPNDTLFTIDETRSKGGKLFLGYDLFKRLSIEAYYSDVGEAEVGSTYPGIPSDEIAYKDYGISALYYALKQHEAHEGFGLFGRVGFGRMKNETELPYERLNDNHAMFGAGLEYAFKNGFALRAELDYYDTDSRLLALSLMKRFGGNKPKESVLEPEPQIQPEPEPIIAPAPPPPLSPPPVPVVVPKIAPAPAPVVEVVKVGQLGIVYFDTDSSALSKTARETLDHVASELLRVPETRVEVRGYTDSRASNAYNQRLSDKRANVVADYLSNKGIAPDRMKPIAFGEDNSSVNDNGSEEELGLSRRVEFRVIEK